MTEQLRRLAESTWTLILARMMAVFGVPTALAITGYAALQFVEIKTDIVEMHTALTLGIEPRVKRLEQDQAEIRSEMKLRTAGRFDKNDAQQLEARMQRDLDRLEEMVIELRKGLSGGGG